MNPVLIVGVHIRCSQVGWWILNDEVNIHDTIIILVSWNVKSKSGLRSPAFVIRLPDFRINPRIECVVFVFIFRIYYKSMIGDSRRRFPMVGFRT